MTDKEYYDFLWETSKIKNFCLVLLMLAVAVIVISAMI